MSKLFLIVLYEFAFSRQQIRPARQQACFVEHVKQPIPVWTFVEVNRVMNFKLL